MLVRLHACPLQLRVFVLCLADYVSLQYVTVFFSVLLLSLSNKALECECKNDSPLPNIYSEAT